MNKIGLLIPKTNLTVEYELQHLIRKKFFDLDKICFYIMKLDYKTKYTDNKRAFLTDIAIDIKNKISDLNYIGVKDYYFFCTSSAIENELYEIYNPTTAIVNEAKQRKIKECYLITPYNEKLGINVKKTLEKNDIKVNKFVNFDLLNTEEYFDFGINNLEKYIIETYKKEYGDIIISCTNLPTIHFIDRLEKKLNVKTISSNSCMFKMIKKMEDL